jgi:ribosomal protein S18 acetylase RimI-like enzyme
MRLRVALEPDVPDLLVMMLAFNRHEEIDWSPALGEPALRRLMADPSLGVVAIIEDDTVAIAGYAVLTWGYDLEWNGRDSFLTELWIQPAARGRGLGAAALDALQDLARQHGAHAMHLMVRTANPRARSLYERAGFQSPARLFLSKPLVE